MDDSAYDKITSVKNLKTLFKRKHDQDDALVTAEKLEVRGIPMVLVGGETVMTVDCFNRFYEAA